MTPNPITLKVTMRVVRAKTIDVEMTWDTPETPTVLDAFHAFVAQFASDPLFIFDLIEGGETYVEITGPSKGQHAVIEFKEDDDE